MSGVDVLETVLAPVAQVEPFAPVSPRLPQPILDLFAAGLREAQEEGR